ncbi:hypothetical protein Pelo_19504 [Pelomyxa schiedti]|nr:hypothetical protein Pelo_19504 [Pelomyxa schiedti]
MILIWHVEHQFGIFQPRTLLVHFDIMSRTLPLRIRLREEHIPSIIPPQQIGNPAGEIRQGIIILQAYYHHVEAIHHHQPLAVQGPEIFMPSVTNNIHGPVIASDTVMHVVPLCPPTINIWIRRCTPHTMSPVSPELIAAPQSRMMGGGGPLNPGINDTQQER